MPEIISTVTRGTRGRTHVASTREDTDYSKGVAVLDRNANPMTLATMEMGRDTAKTIDYHWFEDEHCPVLDQVNNGGGYTAGATSIVVDNGAFFAKGDLVRVPLSDEVMLVTAISTNTLTVTRDFGQATEGWSAKAAALVDNQYLEIVGNAFEQAHPLPEIRHTTEVDFKNYCQDIRTPMGMSDINRYSAHRGEDDWTLQERKAGIEHSEKIERNNFWGKPYVGDKSIYATSNTNPTTCGGINHFLETYAPSGNLKDEDEVTSNEFQDWLETLFFYGSDTRVAYVHPNFRTALDKWGIAKQQTFVKDKMLGMDVGVWLSSHGTIIFKTHKLLLTKDATGYKYGFFLDMEQLKWITFSSIGQTTYRDLDVYAATGETADKAEWRTIQCIKFGLSEHHGRLRWKTVAAA